MLFLESIKTLVKNVVKGYIRKQKVDYVYLVLEKHK